MQAPALSSLPTPRISHAPLKKKRKKKKKPNKPRRHEFSWRGGQGQKQIEENLSPPPPPPKDSGGFRGSRLRPWQISAASGDGEMRGGATASSSAPLRVHVVQGRASFCTLDSLAPGARRGAARAGGQAAIPAARRSCWGSFTGRASPQQLSVPASLPARSCPGPRTLPGPAGAQVRAGVAASRAAGVAFPRGA